MRSKQVTQMMRPQIGLARLKIRLMDNKTVEPAKNPEDKMVGVKD